MVVIVGARDNRRHRRHSSRGGQGRSRSCAAIMFAVLVAALVTVPFILVGPMNLVLSVSSRILGTYLGLTMHALSN